MRQRGSGLVLNVWRLFLQSQRRVEGPKARASGTEVPLERRVRTRATKLSKAVSLGKVLRGLAKATALKEEMLLPKWLTGFLPGFLLGTACIHFLLRVCLSEREF